MIGLFIVNGVVITLFSVTMSDKSITLQRKIEELQEENRKVASELYSKTSLQQVYEKSSSLGFSTSDNILYINGEEPVAELR